MARKIFLPFLCLSFFLGGDWVFGSPSRARTSVSDSAKRYSLRLLMKNQRKQAYGGSEISKRNLSNAMSHGCCEFCRPKDTITPKKIIRKENLDGETAIPKSAPSERVNIEELFLNEIKIAGGWKQLLKKLIKFTERELSKQSSTTL